MAYLVDPPVQTCVPSSNYDSLYYYLVDARGDILHVSFEELESILGFSLPPSARLHRQWWSNRRRGCQRNHIVAWNAAGWMTKDVNVENETLTFVRRPGFPKVTPTLRNWKKTKMLDIDSVLIPTSSASVPPELTFGRDQIYDDSGRLTGGPQDIPKPKG